MKSFHWRSRVLKFSRVGSCVWSSTRVQSFPGWTFDLSEMKSHGLGPLGNGVNRILTFCWLQPRDNSPEKVKMVAGLRPCEKSPSTNSKILQAFTKGKNKCSRHKPCKCAWTSRQIPQWALLAIPRRSSLFCLQLNLLRLMHNKLDVRRKWPSSTSITKAFVVKPPSTANLRI